MRSIEEAIDAFQVERGCLPDGLEDLVGRGGTGRLREFPLDPWGSAFVYERTGPRTWRLTCLGGDGVPGGEDREDEDIVLENGPGAAR